MSLLSERGCTTSWQQPSSVVQGPLQLGSAEWDLSLAPSLLWLCVHRAAVLL